MCVYLCVTCILSQCYHPTASAFLLMSVEQAVCHPLLSWEVTYVLTQPAVSALDMYVYVCICTWKLFCQEMIGGASVCMWSSSFSHATSMALGMATLIGWSVHRSGPDWNGSTTIRCFTMIFGQIQVPRAWIQRTLVIPSYHQVSSVVQYGLSPNTWNLMIFQSASAVLYMYFWSANVTILTY